MAEAQRDQNRVTTLLGVSSLDQKTPTNAAVDPVNNAQLVESVDSSGGVIGSKDTPEVVQNSRNKVWIKNLSSAGLVKWLYYLQSTSNIVRRIMLF